MNLNIHCTSLAKRRPFVTHESGKEEGIVESQGSPIEGLDHGLVLSRPDDGFHQA